MMDEKSGVDIAGGGVRGQKVEKLFFADSKQQLQKFWGLKDFSEIGKADVISLPAEALAYIIKSTDQAVLDGRERSAVLGYDGAGPSIQYEVTGKESLKRFINQGSVKEIGASVQHENSLQFSWNRLFGKPEPIFYHCHPGLKSDDVTTAGVTFRGGERFEVSAEGFLKFINSQMGVFSMEDLETFFQSNRYINSALLGSPERILYIVPSEFYIQAGYSHFNRLHVEYDKAMDAVLVAGAVRFLGIPMEKIAQQKFAKGRDRNRVIKVATEILDQSTGDTGILEARDKVLVEICARAGYVAFGSPSLYSKQLKRLV